MNERLRFLLLGPRLESRRARLARNGLLGLIAAWVLFTYEPRIVFAHEALHERFVFRSDAPIDSNIATVLDRAAEKLRASGIDDPSLRFRLYACNERWRYRLVAPFSSSAFGVNSAGRIALNRSDVAADRIYSGERVRTLSGVIAHEATHSLLRQRYGCVTAARLPGWKSEGICDAVAGESSFPMEMGRALLGAGEEDPSPGFSYLKARLMVELLREEGLSWDEIVERRHDEGEVLERLRARLR